MPTFYGGMVVNESMIRRTDIDMNMANITSVLDPVNEYDAANKHYVDTQVDEVFGGTSGNVELVGLQWVEVCNLLPGTYIVVVTTHLVGGPTAMFVISRADEFKNGSVNRTTASPGNITGEQIELVWNAGEILKIRKTGTNYDGTYTISFNSKTISALPAPPSMPDDVASKNYVDKTVNEVFDVHFSGITVNLQGMQESIVTSSLAVGSYTVTVTSIGINNAPTAVFALSKRSVYSDAMVVVSSSTCGAHTFETLVLSWPQSNSLLLKKTGLNYDGQYRVDFGNKNITATIEPTIPSDIATMAYVQAQIESKMVAQFGGYDVQLNALDWSNVASLRLGCYSLTISPLITGGSTASFVIAKNETSKDASVSRLISVPGTNSNEELEVVWLANMPIQLRKTSVFHDGLYRVDVNLKNIAIPTPIISTDTATKEYVDCQLARLLETHFDGISVTLTGSMNWTDVYNLQNGSYVVTISSGDGNDGAPTALFTISKSSQSSAAHIIKMVNEPGKDTGEQLSLSWDANSPVRLSKDGPFHNGVYKVDFGLRNYATKQPAAPTDVATKNYVDDTLGSVLQTRFGGIVVALTGMTKSVIGDLRNGSYFLSVSSQTQTGPCATFAVSKSHQSISADIVRITSTPSYISRCHLELSWDPHSPMMIRKTTADNDDDGNYVVDFGLKNTVPIPSSSSSVEFQDQLATRDYVDDRLLSWKETFFNGVQVSLIGTEWSTITNAAQLRLGTAFILSVSYLTNDPPGAAAVFAVCKTTNELDAAVHTIVSQSAFETGESFELQWLQGQPLQVRKTLPFHDGLVICDFSIKNLTTLF